jgi:hypothetical protein
VLAWMTTIAHRWAVDRDGEVQHSALVNLMALHPSLRAFQLARHYLTTPGLAVSFVPTADPDIWSGPMTYTNQTPEAYVP